MTKLLSRLAILFFALAFVNTSCVNKKQRSSVEPKKEKLIIFHAGSLTVPLKEISAAFKEVHPGVEILLEAAGSNACARKISDLNKTCDIFASADYSVIDSLLIPKFAEWNIKFAANEMTIVYHDKSKFSEQINDQNWYEILAKQEVAFGRSDPNSDPCGYRAILTTKLAEPYYAKEGLADKLLNKDQKYIRPKETDLLGLLESNAIDYIFLYRSVAEQHGLKYIILPDSINLKNNELADFYKQAKVDVSGAKPGELITKIGEPMIYGVTMVKNAPNKELAMLFLQFMLQKENGLAIMRKNGQPDVVPSPTSTFSSIPESLKPFALSEME